MASLFQKFQQFVATLAKSPTFAKEPRRLQFEADINRLFLYTSYNRIGKDAEEADIEEIINMASKAALQDQERQVQENIHHQVSNFCTSMDEILLPDSNSHDGSLKSSQKNTTTTTPRPSGLSLAIGRKTPTNTNLDVQETKQLTFSELSQKLKDLMGYTLDLKPSQIPHEQAGRGLFIDGEADVGSVIAFYPGVIYSPANYRYIPGYPRVDAQNPYLITRYDGTVINAQPWGVGGETREPWGQSSLFHQPKKPNLQPSETGSDRVWKMLSKPLEGSRLGLTGEILERRNPLALGHFANHPIKGVNPNVMVCPYDFPLSEKVMRVYIPNIIFGGVEEVKMKRFGSFWFKSGGQSDNNGEMEGPIMKSLALVATRALCNEEIYLNYRLSNSKRRPSWYTPVDEEEDRRRWS